MLSQKVTTKDGYEKTIVADNKADLDEGIKAAKSETAATYPNINVPVKKGHDLVDAQEDGDIGLQDGTGAHNSPRDAIRDDGKEEGDKNVPIVGLDEADTRSTAPNADEDGQLPKKSNKK